MDDLKYLPVEDYNRINKYYHCFDFINVSVRDLVSMIIEDDKVSKLTLERLQSAYSGLVDTFDCLMDDYRVVG